MDQVWIRQVVGDVLRKRRLAGEGPVSVLELQQLAGVGPGDATYGAELLAEEGVAVREETPGGMLYRLKDDEEGEPVAAVAASVAELEPPAAFPSDVAVGVAPAAALAAPAAPVANGDFAAALQQLVNTIAVSGGARPVGEPRELRLTSAVAQAIDSDTLGAMILAGVIEAAEARAEFRLVVVP